MIAFENAEFNSIINYLNTSIYVIGELQFVCNIFYGLKQGMSASACDWGVNMS